jgi:hypothetical protein
MPRRNPAKAREWIGAAGKGISNAATELRNRRAMMDAATKANLHRRTAIFILTFTVSSRACSLPEGP